MDRVNGRTDAANRCRFVRFIDGTMDMKTEWILSSRALPAVGKSVDFLVVDRSVPIHGTFLNGVFHAHWADYDTLRVEWWCPSAETPAAAPIAAAKSGFADWLVTAMKRWTHAPTNMGPACTPGKART